MPRNRVPVFSAGRSKSVFPLPGLEKRGPTSLLSAGGGGGRRISLSLELDSAAVGRYMYETDRKSWDPLPTAALDLARHLDLRRARRKLSPDAARLARQQRHLALGTPHPAWSATKQSVDGARTG